MKKLNKINSGFTLIELMVATLVFSVILLLATAGILQIGKTYYKGVAQARTQEAARNIIDDISRGIQFSGEKVILTTPLNVPSSPYPISGGKYGFCINGVGYAYVLDRQLKDPATRPDEVTKALISYSVNCQGFTVSDVTSAVGKELIGLGMRLTNLNIVDSGNDTYTISVGVATGEADLFQDVINNLDGSAGADGVNDSCKSGPGSQYCSISNLKTTVQKRVK